MTNQAFQQGFLALTAAFPGIQFNSDLFWVSLNDLDGEYFLRAIMDIIKNTKELYPGSNMIAIVRGKIIELETQSQVDKTLKLTAESEKQRIERWRNEATPMPEDCRKALEKLGLKTL